MERDGSVRAIGRGLAVLKAINQHGSMNMNSIAKATALPYPTACRIVDTLIDEGMIEEGAAASSTAEREPGRKFYRPTMLVKALSHGYRFEDRLASAARATINDVTRSILWPVTVSTRIGSSMVICESSHRISLKTLLVYYPGHTFPILGVSAGIVYLASCGADERDAVLTSLDQSGELGDAYSRRALERTFDDAKRRGFASYERCLHNTNPGKTSALSVPIMVDGSSVATVTVIYLSSAMTGADAIARYAEILFEAAGVIAGNLSAEAASERRFAAPTATPRQLSASYAHPYCAHSPHVH